MSPFDGFACLAQGAGQYQVGERVLYQLLGGELSYDGNDYFNMKQLKQLAALTDPVERCIFEDSVIRDRATAGTLLKLASLPPWLGGNVRRALRTMTSPEPELRLASIADVAAALTQVRAATSNWRWMGEVAVLRTEAKTVELRPEGDDVYQGYQASSSGGPFRRMPGLKPGGLSALIRAIDV